MLIVFLMLTNPTADFNQPSTDPTKTYLEVIEELVSDIPGSDTVIEAWLKGTDSNANRDRTTAAKGMVDFLSSNGNGWGGPNGCPHDLATMVGWLSQV
jgi:hypothetical protein